jgi:DNA polymerase alpha subunit B
MQDQFEVIEDILKKQLCTEQFEDFMSPIQTC